jgi:ABC-type transport system substrate-binding protein
MPTSVGPILKRRAGNLANLQFAFCNPPRRIFDLHFAIALILLFVSPSAAQPRLLDREPFDQVILKPTNGGDVLNTTKLQLPRRPLVSLPTDGRLTLELLDHPGEKFEVPWANVAEIRVYEQMLMEEARRLVVDGQYDVAYEYFSRLLADYPSFPNLDEAVNAYLRRNALTLHQSQQDERALALLLTLNERNPGDPGLPNAVEVVAGEVIQLHLRNQNYAAARGVLDLWQSQFRDIAKESAVAWQGRFQAAAERQVAEARRLADEKQFIEARKAAQRALAIWPKHAAAAEVLAQIQRDFPFVTVGVFEAAPRRPSRRIDSWSALRVSRLVERLLAEAVDFGAEGGEYRSPFGELTLDESGLVLRFRIDPVAESAIRIPQSAIETPLTADELARYLLAMAEPGNPLYRADFADLLSGVSIGRDKTVELHFKRAHVRPESLLAVPPPPATGSAQLAGARGAPHFNVSEYLPTEVLYSATNAGGGRLQTVVERTMTDDEAAVTALVSGDIDVLDRVPPWQVQRLRGSAGVRVASYRLPTVHVLIPNFDRQLPARREFRRALCYGIDRPWLVQRVLLGGAGQPGFDVLSGPFPTGVSLSDPIRYGYNSQIAPRPFEPRLAAILATVAWAGVQKAAGEKVEDGALADMPTLVLAHPSDPLARNACQLIQLQLKREGIPVELRQFTAEELLAGRVEYDIRYAELAVWEPLTDARRILGPGGLIGDAAGPNVQAALWRLDESTNWKDVRARMANLHEIAHQDLPVIPLWETVNYFAYRDSVAGIGDAPMTLYQNIDNWRSSAGRSVAQNQN